MSFKKWMENGWGSIDAYDNEVPHNFLPKSIGQPAPGMVRLYRGTKSGHLPHSNSFWTDERGLNGIAKPFSEIPGRELVYVDVPEEVAKQCLLRGCVTDGEYQLPEFYRKRARKFN